MIDESGLILTQYRVVKLGETHVVTDGDGERYYATIRSADPRGGLAVLAIKRRLNRAGKGRKDNPPVQLSRAGVATRLGTG